MSAQCNRVAVEDGHTESISVRLRKQGKAREHNRGLECVQFGTAEIAAAERSRQAGHILEGNDRPQPRLDAERGAGMTTTVGRLRPCKVLDWKFTVLSHNTIRGAAGAAVLNAELLKAQGYLG